MLSILIVISEIGEVDRPDHLFSLLVNSRDGICELCGDKATLTQSFFYEGKPRLVCTRCVEEG